MDDHSARPLSLAWTDDLETRRWSEQLLQRSFFVSVESHYNEQSLFDRELQPEGDRELLPADDLLITASGSPTILRSRTIKLDSSEESRKAQSTRSWATDIHDWFWELFAWLSGTLSIVAIILLLCFFDQKLLSQWKSIISINTMVAVLSQAAVPTLLVPVAACIGQMKWVWFQGRRELSDLEAFDLASRGPQGSLRLLFSVRHLLGLASCGAIITIFMLGFPPFVQQAVNANGVRWERSQYNATIRRATRFNDTQLVARLDTPVDQIGPSWSTSMQGPITIGLAGDDNAPSQVPGLCPSANCTWQAYTSLAFCSSIKDVTSTIVENCTQAYTNLSTEIQSAIFNKSCNVTTQALSKEWGPMNPPYPSDFSITTPLDNLGVLIIDWPILYSINDLEYQNVNSLSHNQSLAEAVVINAVVLYTQQAPVDPSSQDVSWPDAPTASPYTLPARKFPPVGKMAFQVSISLCVETLTTNMTNGTTHTDILRSQSDLNWNLNYENGTGWAQADVDGNRYVVDSQSIVALSRFFGEGGFTTTGQVVPGWLGIEKQLQLGVAFDARVDAFTVLAKDMLGVGLDTFDPKFAYENIASRMSNITTSMTNALRTQAGVSSDETAVGDSWIPANFIQVDFRWMVVPLVLWLFASIFFMSTIVKCRKCNAPLWKSSIIALLRLQDEYGASSSMKDIEQDARKVKAQLARSEDAGWLSKSK